MQGDGAFEHGRYLRQEHPYAIVAPPRTETQWPRREVRGRGLNRSGDPGAEEDKMKAGGCAVTLGLLMLAAGPVIAASDERGAVSASGGVFVPYNGSAGPSAALSAEGRVTDALSVGGELEYRQFA